MAATTSVSSNSYGNRIFFYSGRELVAARWQDEFQTYTKEGRVTTHMATVVTKETTPEQLADIVKETLDLLKTSGLSYDEKAVYAQFESMAAEKWELSVEDWRKKWTKAPEPAPEPVKAAPKPRARKVDASKLDQSYFWISPRDMAFIDLWIDIAQRPGVSANLIDTGPSGQGKTEKYLKVGEQKGIPVYKVDCPAIVTVEDWLGHMRVNEKGTYYEKSQHVVWLEQPGPRIILYDEINRLPAPMLSTELPILDRSKKIWLPEIGQHIEVAPGALFVATANLGAAYHGTYPLDFALESRFGFRIETGYPPADEEVKILVNRTGIDDERARLLVDIATQVRNKVPDTLERPVSTRNLLDTAVLVAAGMTIIEAADYTFVKFYSEDGGGSSQRTIVKQVLSGKASGK